MFAECSFGHHDMPRIGTLLGFCWLISCTTRTQRVTEVFHHGLPQSLCQRVHEQDSEPLVAPDEQVGVLHGFLWHRYMNMCVNR